MKEILKEILFSRNRFSVKELHRMLSNGQISKEELAGVLGNDITNVVQSYSSESFYPSGNNKTLTGGVNQVVFWGKPDCGKTSVIASLLSLPGMEIKGLNSGSIQERLNILLRTFRKTAQQVIPQDRSTGSRIYHAKYSQGRRNYRISFIEANEWEIAKSLIQHNHLGLVHVFCVDCRGNLDDQIKIHKATIDKLKDAGLIAQSSGLYILVTKADLMCTPKVYRDNAAQAMITASAQAFWQYVRTTCGENDIYNEQPIVCSVGDFVLSDYATLTTEYTSRLFNEYILPKCEHQHWGLVGLLRKMGKLPAMLITAVLLAAAGTGLYYALDAISQPPTRAMEPFDYLAYFKDGVKQDLGSDAAYEVAREHYKRLRNDLDVEGMLRQCDKDYVLSRDDVNDCDSRLSNAFAVILIKRMEQHFQSSSWTEDSTLLWHSRTDLHDLLKHRSCMTADNALSCNRQLGYLKAYNDSVIPLIAQSKKCSSVEGLNNVRENAEHWNDYPFSNDSTLREDLNNAVFNAYASYSERLLNRAEQVAREYNDLSFWGKITNYSSKWNLEEAATKLYNTVDQLLEQLEEDSDDDDNNYSVIRQRLSSAKQKLYNISNR